MTANAAKSKRWRRWGLSHRRSTRASRAQQSSHRVYARTSTGPPKRDGSRSRRWRGKIVSMPGAIDGPSDYYRLQALSSSRYDAAGRLITCTRSGATSQATPGRTVARALRERRGLPTSTREAVDATRPTPRENAFQCIAATRPLLTATEISFSTAALSSPRIIRTLGDAVGVQPSHSQ